LGELRAAAVESGLDATDRGVDEFGNFLERIVEYVFQKYAGPLLRRQADYEVFEGTPETEHGWVKRFDYVRYLRRRFRLNANAALSQKIDRAIVGDTKQPRLQRAGIVKFVEISVRLEESLLHHVFAVHHGTRHASAISVQTRPKLCDRLKERKIAGLERAGLLEVFGVAHKVSFRLRIALAPDFFASNMYGLNRR
jgi:hypothetical protein